MKINWGTGIVIAFAAFITFIMYFVINMSINKKYEHDLVTEDYYKEELLHQEEIDKETNSKSLNQNVTCAKTIDGIVISFPEGLDYSQIKGKVYLYRPSNKELDSDTTISLSNHEMLIPKSQLLDGRWNIKIDWEYQGKSYLLKKSIVY